jgi:predicted transcriptional regulator
MIDYTTMSTERITVTLPSETIARIKKEARRRKRPVSRLIAEALEERNRQQIRERMIVGYKATREENLRFAEEALPLALETWPSD